MAIPQMAKKKVEMVETEMGRMVPKAAQEKFQKEAGKALDKAVVSSYEMERMAKEEESKAKMARKALFKRGKEAVATPSGRKMTAVMIKTK